jgi:hypothetical protein
MYGLCVVVEKVRLTASFSTPASALEGSRQPLLHPSKILSYRATHIIRNGLPSKERSPNGHGGVMQPILVPALSSGYSALDNDRKDLRKIVRLTYESDGF